MLNFHFLKAAKAKILAPSLVVLTVLFVPLSSTSRADDKPAWKPGHSHPYGDGEITLSQPVLVARSKTFLWFPSLSRLSDGRLLAIMSDYADEHVKVSTANLAWSDNGGLTWSKPVKGRYGDPTLTLKNGDELMLPYYLHPLGENVMGEQYQIGKVGKSSAKLMKERVTVRGWSRPDQINPTTGMAGFVFNGDTLIDNDGKYLAKLYGHYKDTPRYALVLAESEDGVAWTIRSTIAGEDCPLEGAEGPCEAALCRLADGRLMCVFRLASNVSYGQSFSDDEGKTWSAAQAMPGVFSVQPSLDVLPNGSLALSGGRPGIYLWMNRDGKGLTWDKFDVVANHNEFVPDEKITDAGKSSSYTEVVLLDENHLLLIYDRIPHSWAAIPDDSKETNSIWVVRATINE
ncbi:MAG: sialidase family protein [Planctomycetota bacterium]|nr:sialidase family protein [Planctomycetota bacterium]MDA1213461.1 sialidase family protein [Planctomycetota bacterium]